jgi:hypothetical protein
MNHLTESVSFLQVIAESEMKLDCWYSFYCNGVYTCILTSPEITEPATLVKSVTGFQMPGKHNQDVKSVVFLTSINFIPKGQSEFFPNMTKLEIDSCGLKSIGRNDLKDFTETEHENRCVLFCRRSSKFIASWIHAESGLAVLWSYQSSIWKLNNLWKNHV